MTQTGTKWDDFVFVCRQAQIRNIWSDESSVSFVTTRIPCVRRKYTIYLRYQCNLDMYTWNARRMLQNFWMIHPWFPLFFFLPKMLLFSSMPLFCLSLCIQNKGYIPMENSTWKTQRQRINFFLRFFVLMWCCIHLSAHLGKCTHTENYKPAKAIFMRTTFELEKHQLSWCTNNDFFDLLAFSLSLSLCFLILWTFLFHSFVAPYHEKTEQSRTISNCTSHSRYNNNGSKIKKNVICYVMPRGFAVNDFLFSGSFRCWCSDIHIYIRFSLSCSFRLPMAHSPMFYQFFLNTHV